MSKLVPPPPMSPLPSFPSHSASAAASPSGSKISPVVLLVIIILAVIFFVCGVLHLLVRFLMKRPSFYSSVSHSNRHPENPALQRQLQQLFRLHDSGLDQALIDALPVFDYSDIMGLKEPFDCAVCLCEFSDQDKLRLLPMCSHAFHITCIDTWLLSNSTCPLCRGSLLSSGLDNQDLSLGCSIDGDKPTIMEESASDQRRVFSVRLGKYRSSNNGGGVKETSTSSSSSIQLDSRRCYSLGSYQYVLADSNLQVALLSAETGNSKMVDVDVEGKKIRRNKGDSFSVSKIWLWSKKTNLNAPPPLNVILPLSIRNQIIH